MVLSHADSNAHAPTCYDVGGFTATCSICPQERTHYYTRQTGAHVFRADRYSDRYCCAVCGLSVLEYGKFGKDNALTYYINENYNGDLRMTLSGIGEIPDFSHENPPPWLESKYLSNLKTITLEPGITRIGANAFSANADGTNPYASVAQCVYKNTLLDTTPDANWSGVRAVATYLWDGVVVRSSEATAYFLRYIVEQYDTESLTFGDLPAWAFWFYLYDMTGDGQEELIVRTGSCEADAQYIFYTYSNGNVREAGRIGATHTGISGISDGTGVIRHHGSQGWESADRITISDGELVREVLIEPQEVDQYTVFENVVTLIPYTREQATNFTGGKG